MNTLKKIFIITCLALVAATSFGVTANAANIFGYDDPPGCGGKDPFLPNLLICGRNAQSAGACSAYTKPCSLGDLVETGSRAIVWLISIVLLIVPLIVMYYGAMIIITQQMGGSIVDLAKLRDSFKRVFIYFILMLAAWLIVRTVVDVFQVDPRINTFLIDENGNTVKARTFNVN